MRAQHARQGGPSGRDSHARLGVVKAPRDARPRPRRAAGLDRACDELRMALVDGPAGLCPRRDSSRFLNALVRRPVVSSAPSILVTIGQESRIYHAFVTSAPCSLDAPSTMTLHASTWGDVVGFTADDCASGAAPLPAVGRLVLVGAVELHWQEARYEEAGHLLAAADGRLLGLSGLQRWLWRRLFALPETRDKADSHGTDTSSR